MADKPPYSFLETGSPLIIKNGHDVCVYVFRAHGWFFDRIASLCALLAGLGSLVYALAFLLLGNSGLSALVLLLVGLLSATALPW